MKLTSSQFLGTSLCKQGIMVGLGVGSSVGVVDSISIVLLVAQVLHRIVSSISIIL